MKLEDILTLIKAGYTREEIDKLEKPEAPAESAPLSKTPDEAKPAATQPTPPAKAPETAAPEAPAKAPETAGNEQIMGAINALTAAIQKMNVQSSSIPGGDDPEPTPEDILANIINPPKLK